MQQIAIILHSKTKFILLSISWDTEKCNNHIESFKVIKLLVDIAILSWVPVTWSAEMESWCFFIENHSDSLQLEILACMCLCLFHNSLCHFVWLLLSGCTIIDITLKHFFHLIIYNLFNFLLDWCELLVSVLSVNVLLWWLHLNLINILINYI